jgi:hypothetical protein
MITFRAAATVTALAASWIAPSGVCDESNVSTQDRVAAFQSFVTDDPDCLIAFTYRLQMKPELYRKLGLSDPGARTSDLQRQDRHFYIVARTHDALHIRYSRKRDTFSHYSFSPEHVALGWSSNALWAVLGGARMILFDYDIGRTCTSSMDALLLQPGIQSYVHHMQHAVNRALRLGLPLLDSRIEWDGHRFRSNPVSNDSQLIEGQLHLQNGEPWELRYSVRDASGTTEEGHIQLGYGSRTALYPTELTISRAAPGEPLLDHAVLFTELTISTLADEELTMNVLSPMRYFDANSDNMRVNVVSNKLMSTVFLNGEWLAHPIVAFRTDGQPLTSQSQLTSTHLAVLSLLLLPVAWFVFSLLRRPQRPPSINRIDSPLA